MKKICLAALILTLLWVLAVQISCPKSFSVSIPPDSTLVIQAKPQARITLRNSDGRPIAQWHAERLALALPPGDYRVEVRGAKTLVHTLIISKSGKDSREGHIANRRTPR